MQKFNYRTARISADFAVRLRMSEDLICGRCTDISEDGLGAALPQITPVGTVGAVVLVSPTEEIEVCAQVVAHFDQDEFSPAGGTRDCTLLLSAMESLTPEFELRAKVAYSGLYRTGIAFLFSGEEERSIVRRFISSLPKLP